MRDSDVIPFPGAHTGRSVRDRDDDELMQLSAAGRSDAFEVLVARHMPRLTGFCIASGRQQAHALLLVCRQLNARLGGR